MQRRTTTYQNRYYSKTTRNTTIESPPRTPPRSVRSSQLLVQHHHQTTSTVALFIAVILLLVCIIANIAIFTTTVGTSVQATQHQTLSPAAEYNDNDIDGDDQTATDDVLIPAAPIKATKIVSIGQQQQQQQQRVQLNAVFERHVFGKLLELVKRRIDYHEIQHRYRSEVYKHRILSEGPDDKKENRTVPPFFVKSNKAMLEDLKNYIDETGRRPIRSSCTIPLAASDACTESAYTILAVITTIYDNANDDGWLRILFINCLKWMVDKSVTYIYVLLPNQLLTLIQNNKSYGQRLLEWNKQKNHPVKLLFGHTLWDVIKIYYNISTTTTGNTATTAGSISSSNNWPLAVVWVSGDKVWYGNSNGLQNGFQLWKQRSASFVTNFAWQFQYVNNSNVRPFTVSPGGLSSKSLPSAKQHLRRIDILDAENIMNSHNNNDDNWPILVDLETATFHHRDYLCFIQKDALSALRNNNITNGNNWDNARFAIANFLSAVAPSESAMFFDDDNDNNKSYLRRRNAEHDGGSNNKPVSSDASSSSSSGTFVHDVRFFSIFSSDDDDTKKDLYDSSRRITTTTTTTHHHHHYQYSSDDNNNNNNSTQQQQKQILELDESKITILSLFGGTPPLPRLLRDYNDNKHHHHSNDYNIPFSKRQYYGSSSSSLNAIYYRDVCKDSQQQQHIQLAGVLGIKKSH